MRGGRGGASQTPGAKEQTNRRSAIGQAAPLASKRIGPPAVPRYTTRYQRIVIEVPAGITARPLGRNDGHRAQPKSPQQSAKEDEGLQLGMIGLGKMGSGMTRRLLSGGHEVVVFDRNPRAVAAATANGAVGAVSSEGLADKLTRPRAVWVMVPSGEPTERTIVHLAEVLEPGDTII